MKVGRPTAYKKEYCSMLIKHMEQGYSFESFAGLIDTCKQTLYNWTEAYPEFLDSYKIGQEKCRGFWEKKGIEGLETKVEIGEDGTIVKSNINPTMWIFNMKNRFKQEWKDKHDIEHSGQIKTIEVITQTEKGKREIEKLK